MDSSYFNNIQDPIARAEAMRAQAIATLITDAVEGLRDLLKGAAAKVSGHLEYRRNLEQLSAMTDRELDDIGITRGDVEAVARGFDPRRPAAVDVAASGAMARRLALATAYDRNTAVEAPANDKGRRETAAAA